MGSQLHPEPTSLLNPQQYSMPLYTDQALQGYHLMVVTDTGSIIRQPFALDSFFNSYAEFIDSGVLPHLISLLDIVYGVEPVGGDTSVWRGLEKNPDAQPGELHPTFWLAMNTPNDDFERSWFIRLVYQTARVAKSVR